MPIFGCNEYFIFEHLNIHGMKVLVLGPSGSGKTYVSHVLQRAAVPAFDDSDIEGLSAWYDQHGTKVPPPQNAAEAMVGHYAFLWRKKVLARFLERFSDVYVFGGAGNIFSMLGLFHKVYFLKVTPELQKERLRSPSRENPEMDRNGDDTIVWGGWFEEEVKKRNIPFIDASLTPQQIFDIISK